MNRWFNLSLIIILSLIISNEGLGSICVSNGIHPELNADSFFLGPELAFKDSRFKDYRLFLAITSTKFSEQLQQMTSDSCSVVLGLITSKECLIAGPILQKKKIIGVSPCCGHDSIGKYYPYLYAGGPPLSKEASAIVEYLKKVSDIGKIFVIYKPADVYSEEVFTQFKNKFHSPFVEVRISTDGEANLKDFSYQPQEKIFLLFFTYPLASIKVLVNLAAHQKITKNTTILGGSSWGDEVILFKPIKSVLGKAKQVINVEIIDWNKTKNSAFVKRFSRQYNREPLDSELINYDITRFVVRCYRRSSVNGKTNLDKFQNCMAHEKYRGIAGSFSFDKASSFADRRIYFNNLLNRI